MKLSIIIPVFNEEKTIQEVLKRVLEVKLPVDEKEIILVNDGSYDGTKAKIHAFQYKNQLQIFHHKVNQGKGAAVRTGIKKATGDYIVIQDADLEYHPKQIGTLLQPILKKKAHIVYGTRLKRLPHLGKEESHPLFLLHYIGNRSLSLFTSILYGQWVTDIETCYKLFPKQIVSEMTLHARGFEFEPEITAKFLKRRHIITEIPITTIPRSKHEGKKLRTFHDGFICLYTLLKYRFTE